MTIRGHAYQWVILVLLIAVQLWTLFSIVIVTHESRKKFSQLENLRDEHQSLMEDWGRLLLEQSTFSSPSRIERIAREELHMTYPDLENLESSLDHEQVD